MENPPRQISWFWAHLGLFWTGPGPSSAGLGQVLGHLGQVLGHFGQVLGTSWAILAETVFVYERSEGLAVLLMILLRCQREKKAAKPLDLWHLGRNGVRLRT